MFLGEVQQKHADADRSKMHPHNRTTVKGKPGQQEKKKSSTCAALSRRILTAVQHFTTRPRRADPSSTCSHLLQLLRGSFSAATPLDQQH